MTKCLVCGREVPCTGHPPYIIKHIDNEHHTINGADHNTHKVSTIAAVGDWVWEQESTRP